MQAVDQQVINEIVANLELQKACWLATVVATYGSSPRPEGSLLTCNADGHIVGSLSGGCVEDDLLEKLTQGKLAKEKAQFFRYGETAEEAEKLGLPCGGHLDIVVEPLHTDGLLIQNFTHIAQRLSERRLVSRSINLTSGKTHIEDIDQYRALSFSRSENKLQQTYGPRYQLFIIGAAMVSQYVAEFAKALDYHVTVCDPRSDILEAFPVLDIEKICDMPDDAIKSHANDRMSAIVALTHDPRIDDMGLLQALTTEAFYVGAMGSSRTSASRRERLQALDITDSQMERLHAPIGLKIGSKTPPEIAIAILAEITAKRKDFERTQDQSLAAA
jgi:xanthine dehydrogenase accessory factor